MLAAAATAAAATAPLPCGIITCWHGPQPLGQGLLTQEEPGEFEHQLDHLCQLPCQLQGLLQLQQVVPKQC